MINLSIFSRGIKKMDKKWTIKNLCHILVVTKWFALRLGHCSLFCLWRGKGGFGLNMFVLAWPISFLRVFEFYVCVANLCAVVLVLHVSSSWVLTSVVCSCLGESLPAYPVLWVAISHVQSVSVVLLAFCCIGWNVSLLYFIYIYILFWQCKPVNGRL